MSEAKRSNDKSSALPYHVMKRMSNDSRQRWLRERIDVLRRTSEFYDFIRSMPDSVGWIGAVCLWESGYKSMDQIKNADPRQLLKIWGIGHKKLAVLGPKTVSDIAEINSLQAGNRGKMANDRIFIKCKGCGASKMLLTQDNRLKVKTRRWIESHADECHPRRYFIMDLDGDPGFILFTESSEIIENKKK